MIRELARLMFFRRTYPLLLDNYHITHRRRRLNSRQLRLRPDYLLRSNSFCGTVEDPKRENQGTSDLSHKFLTLNRFFAPSLARVIHSNKQQFVVAQYSYTFSFFRNSLPTFSFYILSKRCLNVTNSTLTASGRLPTVGSTWHLTVLLTEVYWS